MTLTFGTLPDDNVILAAFEARCPDGYSVVLGRSDARIFDQAGVTADTIGTWHGPELVSVLGQLTAAFEDGDDDAGMLASSILTTLGIHWI